MKENYGRNSNKGEVVGNKTQERNNESISQCIISEGSSNAMMGMEPMDFRNASQCTTTEPQC